MIEKKVRAIKLAPARDVLELGTDFVRGDNKNAGIKAGVFIVDKALGAAINKSGMGSDAADVVGEALSTAFDVFKDKATEKQEKPSSDKQSKEGRKAIDNLRK